jgi:G3E family GTPase
MTLMFDARVAVAFGTFSDVREGDAVLNAGLGDSVAHAAGCACCTPRSKAAETLSRLFVQRARGEVAFFNRILVIADGAEQEAVEAALQSDPLVSARFRPV